MKKIVPCFLFFTSFVSGAAAQFTDNFSDGNYTSNPVWTGGAGDWIVNPAFQLQSNNTTANAVFYLTTSSTLATTAQWDFYCNLSFNPSGTNFVDVFLTASAADLSLNSTSGYFVRIGNTADEICLYKKDAAGIITKIIDGADGILNSANNVMRIRVIRNAANLWILSRDLTGSGTSYFTEGTVTDNTFNTSSYFGILIRQSTSSFFQRHFFDDFTVQNYVPDLTPPAVVSSVVTSANTVDVLFNEAVDITTSQTILNYNANNGMGNPVSAVRDAVNSALVHLTFANNFPNRILVTMSIMGVKDIAGNVIVNGSTTFFYFTAVQYDVVIDEIMADPTPAVSLPANEWLELKNTTAFSIDLQNWRLGKSTGLSGPMPSYVLAPGAYVIVCNAGAVAAMAQYGAVISVTGFPSLNNDADQIYIRSPQNIIIHSVSYTDAWYKNELKNDGGWTLEMIDPKNPCTGIGNWTASIDPRGGTPAAVNSVNANNVDVTLPKLLRAYAPDPLHVTLVFDEPLDSTSAATAASYTISDGIGSPINATPLSIMFDRVSLTLSTALQPTKIYSVVANNVKDCSANAIGTARTARVGLFAHMDSLDVVINEILFNPKPNGTDYVEFFNRSKKILNLKNAYIANRNSAGVTSSISQFINEDYLFFPGDYIVVTADPESVKRDYVANNPNAILKVSSMPSYNDDAGDVIVLNEQGNIIDEVKYLHDWHFALISNDEGVALERINPDASSVQSNFHSAASNIGYGTPTYKNSQYRSDAEVTGTISVSPDIISPDNDGMDDFATIQYSFPDVGYVANITIFDAIGRPVRYLQRNALNGLKGYYRWDGLGEKQQKLPVGIYIIYTEIFNLEGKTKKFKNSIVLARKF